jgi:tetratricopeptide (TPR) repeat protein
MFCNVSCSQTLDKKLEAQQLINKGSKIMYDVPKEIKAAEAAELFEKAILLDSTKRLAFQCLIYCYNTLGKHKNSILTCTKWLRYHPDDIGMLTARGMLNDRLKYTMAAQEDYAKIHSFLLKQDTLIDNNMSSEKIENIMQIATLYYIINEEQISLTLLENLHQKYPNNNPINALLTNFKEKSREKYIIETSGF